MFFIPLPISEIVCFLSMIVTSLYLLVGTLSNIHLKQNSEINEKTISIIQTIHIECNLKSYNNYPNTLQNTKSNHESEFAFNKSTIFKINKSCYWQPVFYTFLFVVGDFSNIPNTRGPPCK